MAEEEKMLSDNDETESINEEEILEDDKDKDLEEDEVESGDENDEDEEEESEIINDGKTKEILDLDIDYGDNDDNDDIYEDYEMEDLQKFDEEIKTNYIANYHPEEVALNYDEIRALSTVTRDNNDRIVDELHKTLPILTKYEYTRILGIRAKQINEGAQPMIKLDKTIIDGYLIAQIEIKQKKVPFILKRPLPNGGIEYWKISDLEILF